MFCVKCGAKIDDSSNFCENCGARLEPNQNIPNYTGTPPNSGFFQNAVKNKKVVAAVLIVAVVVAIAVFVYPGIGKGSDPKRLIPGTWSGDWSFSNHDETTFYDDGTIEDFSSYRWSIINGNILKIESIGGRLYKYTIEEINNKRMTLRYESGSTVTLYRK